MTAPPIDALPGAGLALLQAAADAAAELAGRPVGHIAATLATDPRLRPVLEVPAFVEWVAAEISSRRRPLIETGRIPGAPRAVHDDRLRAVPVVPIDHDDDAAWSRRIDAVLASDALVAFLQPIVDLRSRAVVGYEALARFPDLPGVSPLRWFTEAAARDRHGELEALAVRAALARRSECPEGCFLSINVSPRALGTDAVRSALSEPDDLDRVVIELTATPSLDDVTGIARHTDALKASGAQLAVSYIAGHTSEQELAVIRPSLVRLTEPFIMQSRREHGDVETGVALAQIAGPFGTRLLAQDVEHAHGLPALERLGVRLVQGFVVGVPTTTWHPLANTVAVTAPGIRVHGFGCGPSTMDVHHVA